MQSRVPAYTLIPAALACGLVLTACSVAVHDDESKEHANVEVKIEHMNLPHLPEPPGFTHIVTSSPGKTVYLSGQGGFGEDGELPDDFITQAENTFKNLQKCLETAGATFNDVVKMNYYLVDINDLAELRGIRSRYVNMDTPPASTLVQAPLIGDLLIEIDAIAVVPE